MIANAEADFCLLLSNSGFFSIPQKRSKVASHCNMRANFAVFMGGGRNNTAPLRGGFRGELTRSSAIFVTDRRAASGDFKIAPK